METLIEKTSPASTKQHYRIFALSALAGVSTFWSAAQAQPVPPVDRQPPFMGTYAAALTNDAARPFDKNDYAAAQLYRTDFYLEEFVDYTSWNNLDGTNLGVLTPSMEWQRKHPNGKLVITIGMLPGPLGSQKPYTGESFARGAAGDYDFHWRNLADRLIAGGAGSCIIRIGHEFNGFFYPWSVQHLNGSGFDDTPANFVAYWRKIVTAMRTTDGVNPRSGANFKFCWNGAILDNQPVRPGPIIPANTLPIIQGCFPGAAFVDYVGVDLYDSSFIAGTYPYTTQVFPYGTSSDVMARQDRAWNDNVGNTRYGFTVWKQIAINNNVPMTIPEWGVMNRKTGGGAGHGGLDNPRFIQRMFDLIHNPANKIEWHIYFDYDNSDIDSGLTQLPTLNAPGARKFPLSSDKFFQLFKANPFPRNTGIGSFGLAGSSSSGAVAGSGGGYGLSASDNFHFAAQAAPAAPNDVVMLQIKSKSTAAGAQSGLMLRPQGTAANAPYVALYLANGQCILQSRQTAGAIPVQNNIASGINAPAWLKLVRRGNAVTGYVSADGLNWSAAGAANVSLGATATFGVAVSSANTTALNTTTIDNVNLVNIPTHRTTSIAGAVIRDNSDPGFTTFGAWNPRNNRVGFFGADFADAGGVTAPASRFNYAPTNLSTGLYSVYARWVIDNSFEDSVPVEVTSADGITRVIVNQQSGLYQWNYLGTYSYNSGTPAGVTILREVGGGFTFADAVMFVPHANVAATYVAEAETVANITTSVGDTASTFTETAASGGAGSKLNSNAVDDFINYPVTNIPAGTYTVKVRYKNFTTRGIFQLSIDGVNQGGLVDEYGTTLPAYVEVSLGAKTLTQGTHNFRFTVKGQNASSTGFDLTIDSITLTPQ